MREELQLDKRQSRAKQPQEMENEEVGAATASRQSRGGTGDRFGAEQGLGADAEPRDDPSAGFGDGISQVRRHVLEVFATLFYRSCGLPTPRCCRVYEKLTSFKI